MKEKSAITIECDALWGKLEAWSHVGARDEGGVDRQALTGSDLAARDRLVAWGRKLGLEVWSDAAANVFVELGGEDPSLAPIYFGSHLDTQPEGGRFDGVLGVAAGQVILEAMVEAGWRGRRSIVLVSWSNEEGCRFAPACTGSGYFSGKFGASELEGMHCEEGESYAALADAWVKKSGVDCRDKEQEPAAFIELHIEQDTILEESRSDVGIVRYMQGCAWLEVCVEGRNSHAGTLELSKRRDALLGACEQVVALRKMAEGFGKEARVTVGKLDVHPNTANTVAGRVRYTIDLRHPQAPVLQSMIEKARTIIGTGRHGLKCSIKIISEVPRIDFSGSLSNCLAAAANRLGVVSQAVVSGAFHDAGQLARSIPSVMIFAPSREGISHCAEEWTSPEQCWKAAQVLCEALQALANNRQFSRQR